MIRVIERASAPNLSDEKEKYDHYYNHLDFPFGISEQGGIRTTDASDHIKDEIITVLLTAPGERVNQPEFGCGLKELVFAPNNGILLSTMVDFRVEQALDRWLGDMIVADEVNVQAIEERLEIEIVYTIKETTEQDSVILTV
jgi:phage baseplate assembly protein W